MRNYVIINGKKSDYVRGLMIQELPPITLPPMRTEIIEIEGRDGDIVEKLGYQAYDKEFTIGLYGDYDVNQIISYFAQSGSIIFSNEPDKYYQFEMINQIELERLIRYKTATITLHVQPFKYSAINEYYNFTGGIVPYGAYQDSQNGVDLLSYGKIEISGLSTSATYFRIPVDVIMDKGDRQIKVKVVGSGFRIGLFDGESYFGGDLTYVSAGETIISGTIDELTKFNELVIYVPNRVNISAVVTLSLMELDVWNDGNVESAPKYQIQGSGLITLAVNDKQPFLINLPPEYSTIILDVENLDAYYGDANMNRIVSGDYRDLKLEAGNNQISIDGNVQQIIIEKYERWL